jgi:hypothetical protein
MALDALGEFFTERYFTELLGCDDSECRQHGTLLGLFKPACKATVRNTIREFTVGADQAFAINANSLASVTEMQVAESDPCAVALFKSSKLSYDFDGLRAIDSDTANKARRMLVDELFKEIAIIERRTIRLLPTNYEQFHERKPLPKLIDIYWCLKHGHAIQYLDLIEGCFKNGKWSPKTMAYQLTAVLSGITADMVRKSYRAHAKSEKSSTKIPARSTSNKTAQKKSQTRSKSTR